MRVARLVARFRSLTQFGLGFAAMTFAGRFGPVRALFNAIARRRRPVVRGTTGAGSSVLEPVTLSRVLAPLRTDGLGTGLQLRGAMLEELREVLSQQPCYGSGNRELAFRACERAAAERRFGQSFVQAHYYELDRAHPIFVRLRQDPALLQIARQYFDCEPVWTGTRVWWSFAIDASEEQRRLHGQAYHYDVDDFNALNFFFYLTDVDIDGGAHVMVRGSHRRKRLGHLLRLRRSRTDEEMLRVYGADLIETVCGPAGSGFVEDPFTFHKATHPRLKDRLILQVRFATRDYQAASERAHSARLVGSLRV